MKKFYFTAAVVGAFLVGFYVGCGDEVNGTVGTERYVYEVSEANVTGAGGYVDVPTLNVGEAGVSGARNMASVVVYGNGRGKNNRWIMLSRPVLSEGRVWIDHDEHESHYYRVVVIY